MGNNVVYIALFEGCWSAWIYTLIIVVFMKTPHNCGVASLLVWLLTYVLLNLHLA